MQELLRNIQKRYHRGIRYSRKRFFHLHPFVVPVTTFFVLFIATAVAFVFLNGQPLGPSDARVVQVYDEGKRQIVPTRAQTVGELLTRLKIEIYDGDVVEPATDTIIYEDNMKINIYRALPVTIVDGNTRQSILSVHFEPRLIAESAGISLYPEDEAILRQNDDILRNQQLGPEVVIERSIPLRINLYGLDVPLRTRARTVEALLKEQDINITDHTIHPSADSATASGQVVFVTYPGKTIQTAEETLSFATETVDDKELAFGQTTVKQEGSTGRKVMVYEIDPNTGERRVLQEVIATHPVNKIIARGRKITAITTTVSDQKAQLMAAAGISASDYAAVDFIISKESGWKPGSVSSNKCIGLGQNCPDRSGNYWLVEACPNWQADPVCQLKRFTVYAGRYGGWQGAYNAWLAQGWW